jgi:Tol biopolymer transport system component
LDIWIVSADGARLRQLTDHPASDGIASWSPDGQWMAFGSTRSGENRIWRVAVSGGVAEQLTTGPAQAPHWARDGEHIYFTGMQERVGNIWRLSLRDRIERPVTNLAGRRGEPGRMAPDTDGKFLYFTWREDTGDIWVMDVVR